MTERLGSLDLADSSPDADPLLCRLGEFLAAVLVQRTAEAWGGLRPGYGPAVSRVLTNPPDQAQWADKDLPALFIWRTQSDPSRRIARDWTARPTTIQASWMFPAVPDLTQAQIAPFANRVHAQLVAAIARGRDPAWQAVGDPDPSAAKRGTVLLTTLRLFTLTVERARPGVYRQTREGAPPRDFETLEMLFAAEELLTQDLADFQPANGLVQTVKLVATPADPDPLAFDVEDDP